MLRWRGPWPRNVPTFSCLIYRSSTRGRSSARAARTSQLGRRRNSPAKPNAHKRSQCHHCEKSVHRDKNPGRDTRHIGSGRRHAGIEMAPHCSAKAEGTEQHEQAARANYQPLRDKPRKQCLCSDAARHSQKAGAHPSGVGTLSGKDRAVGRELGGAVGAVLDLIGAVLDLFCALGELFATALQGRVRHGQTPLFKSNNAAAGRSFAQRRKKRMLGGAPGLGRGRTSIVDVLKLLHLDSSIDAAMGRRRENPLLPNLDRPDRRELAATSAPTMRSAANSGTTNRARKPARTMTSRTSADGSF
jgi:hypothetical protein